MQKTILNLLAALLALAVSSSTALKEGDCEGKPKLNE